MGLALAVVREVTPDAGLAREAERGADGLTEPKAVTEKDTAEMAGRVGDSLGGSGAGNDD